MSGGRFGHPGLDPVDRRDTDFETLGGGVDRRAFVEKLASLMGDEGIDGRSARPLHRACETGHDTVAEDSALELAEDAQHGEHGASCWGRGVEPLGVEI